MKYISFKKRVLPSLLLLIMLISVAAPSEQAKAACINMQSCGGLSLCSLGNNLNCINSCNKNCTSVQIGNNVACVGDCAFSGCKNLNNITLPNCVKSVGDCAFSGCSNLSTVTLGANTKEIGDNAFKNCKNLKTIKIKSKKLNAKNVSDNAFKGVGGNVKVQVPKDKVKSYKSLFCKKGLCKQAKVCGKF